METKLIVAPTRKLCVLLLLLFVCVIGIRGRGGWGVDSFWLDGAAAGLNSVSGLSVRLYPLPLLPLHPLQRSPPLPLHGLPRLGPLADDIYLVVFSRQFPAGARKCARI